MKRVWIAIGLAGLIGSVHAQGKIPGGGMSARSGPPTLAGAEQRRGLEIALDNLATRIGGIPTDLVTADTKGNPGATVQELSRLLEKERVDVLIGLSASNEILAAIKPIT